MSSVGVLGVGTMSSAIITGLCTLPNPPKRVVLSPRGATRASTLQSIFPTMIEIATSNQSVVDEGPEILILSVLPPQVATLLESLDLTRFKGTFVSVVSSTRLSELPVGAIRALPLPPVARHVGSTLVYPHNTVVEDMFSSLGSVFPLDSEDDFSSLLPLSCAMGAYYETLRTMGDWVASHGVSREIAHGYVSSLFHGIAVDARHAGTESENGLQDLVDEQTPGGLNEGVIRLLKARDVFTNYTEVLEFTRGKITGAIPYDQESP